MLDIEKLKSGTKMPKSTVILYVAPPQALSTGGEINYQSDAYFLTLFFFVAKIVICDRSLYSPILQ